jgi:CubicO group peptidase (beta-lactamase class C family)
LYFPWSEADGFEPSAEPDRLLRLLRDLMSATRHEHALLVAEELVRAAPDHALSHYNHACVLARLRRSDEAFEALDRAVDAGWRNIEHTRLDLDLQSLRSDARFAGLLSRIEALREQERLQPAPLRRQAWPEVANDLDRHVPEILERYQVPGAVVALVRDGEVVWTFGQGVSNRALGTPMDESTRFVLRAPAQLLALIAILKQHEAGHLDLAEVATLVLDARHDEGPGPVLVRSGAGRRTPAPTRLTPSAARDPWSGWSRGGDSATFSLMRLLVEMNSDVGFCDYCEDEILAANGAEATSFGLPRNVEALASGHTRMGTPLPVPPPLARPHTLTTTAGDLALVTASLSADGSNENTTGRLALIRDVAELEKLSGGGLGLRVRAWQAPEGLRVQLTDEAYGLGCLLRWYPEHRDGVVILYNCEGGQEAARRIAHLALGGT